MRCRDHSVGLLRIRLYRDHVRPPSIEDERQLSQVTAKVCFYKERGHTVYTYSFGSRRD